MNPLTVIDIYNLIQYYNFQNNADAIRHWLLFLIFKKERKKKLFSLACSRFVNTFSRISKNCEFRFQIFYHIDLVLQHFCFRYGGGVASGTLSNYNVLNQKNAIQRQQCSYDTNFKNNEAVLAIKWFAAQQTLQMTCAPSEDSDPPNLARVFAVRLTEVKVITYPYSAQRRLIRLGGFSHCPESSLIAHVILFVLSCSSSNIS